MSRPTWYSGRPSPKGTGAHNLYSHALQYGAAIHAPTISLPWKKKAGLTQKQWCPRPVRSWFGPWRGHICTCYFLALEKERRAYPKAVVPTTCTVMAWTMAWMFMYLP